MGYYLGYALSLFGRSQDRLSHVLVSDGYEGHPEFYYPSKNSKVNIHAITDLLIVSSITKSFKGCWGVVLINPSNVIGLSRR